MTDLFRLDGQVVAVIGAGSGIGAACAVGAARQGARVVCLDVNEPAASATGAAIGGRDDHVESGAIDITDEAMTAQRPASFSSSVGPLSSSERTGFA